MASMWRQAMLYLGLGPDEQYDELDGRQQGGEASIPDEQVTVVTSPAQPLTMPERSEGMGTGVSEVSTGSVRTIPITSAKPHVVAPRNFNDAEEERQRLQERGLHY